MGRYSLTPAAVQPGVIPPPLLTPDQWGDVVGALRLSPQQARIIGRILQGQKDKQISRELGLNRYTIRTYLQRVFIRIGVEDRMELVLHIFSLCMQNKIGQKCPPKG